MRVWCSVSCTGIRQDPHILIHIYNNINIYIYNNIDINNIINIYIYIYS